MAVAFLSIFAALLLSLLQLAYFNFPGAFLLQLGFSECILSSPTHALWTVLAVCTPLLPAPLLWQSSRAFHTFPRHPLFAFHHLVLFLAGLLLANGFFGLRLLSRLDSAPLQAALLVGYLLTLDFCLRLLISSRFLQPLLHQRPLWLSLLFCFSVLGYGLTQDLAPSLRTQDLGVLRLRFVGRAVWKLPCPVCFSRSALRELPRLTAWTSADLQQARLQNACLAWPLEYELPAVWSTCITQPLRTSVPRLQSYPRLEKRLLEGDPRTGEVHFLGQIHNRPEDTPQARADVTDTQEEILREISNYPGLPVFNESTCEGELPLERDTAGRARQKSSLFAQLFLENPSWSRSFRSITLSAHGAVDALDFAGELESYATATCLDPKLTELERLEDHLDASTPATPGYNADIKRLDSLRFDYRESKVIEILHSHFQSNPGTRVLLVYGEAHRFAAPLWRPLFGDKPPRLTSIRWITPLAATWELADLGDATARLAWIQKHPIFRLRALASVRSPTELWALLPKLSPEYYRNATKDEARQHLAAMLQALPFQLSSAEHLRLHEWLWASFHSGSGPFAGYDLDTADRRDFAALDWMAQSKALEDFDNPQLQWQALQVMSRIDLLAYPHLMLPQARRYALDRLEVRPELRLSRQEIEAFLSAANQSFVDPGGNLASRVKALYGISGSGPDPNIR